MLNFWLALALCAAAAAVQQTRRGAEHRPAHLQRLLADVAAVARLIPRFSEGFIHRQEMVVQFAYCTPARLPEAWACGERPDAPAPAHNGTAQRGSRTAE